MRIRLIVQPTVAAYLGVRAGLKDAGQHRPAYLWAVLRNATERRALLRGGWKDIGRLWVLAFTLDAVYQIAVLHWFYTIQALMVAALLGVVPYVAIRGPVARVARSRWP